MLRRRARLLASLAGVALVLSGCVSIDQQVKVKEDGSGTMTAEIIYSPALVEYSKTLGEEITSEGLVEDTREDQDDTELPRGVDLKIEPLKGKDVGIRAIYTFQNLNQLNELLADTGSDDSGESSLERSFSGSVTRDGDRFEFRATAPSTESFTEGLSGDSEFGSQMFKNLPKPSYIFSMKLPGSIVETNGTKKDGAVSWDLLAENGPDELVLTTQVGGGIPWLLVGGVLLILFVAVIGAGVTGLLLLRRKSRPSAMAAGTGSSAGYIPDPVAAISPWGWQAPAGAPPTAQYPNASDYSTPAPGQWGAPTSGAGQWGAPVPPTPPAAPVAPTPPAAPVPPTPPPAPAPQPEPTYPTPPTDQWGTPIAPTPPAAPVPPTPPPAPAPQPEPTPPVSELPPAGWYPDPENPAQARWWDGRQWSS